MKPIDILTGETPANSFTARQAAALLLQARTLQAHAQWGAVRPLLKGQKLALMTERSRSEAAALFRHAATELGAHVSTIRPSLDDHSPDKQIQATSRVLSRLYSLVECQGLPQALVDRLAGAASIPVFSSSARLDDPSAALVAQMPGDAPAADKRRWILQALLLAAIN